MKSKKIQVISLLLAMTSALVLSAGCSSDKNTPIVTVNDKKLFMKDFLYDIYLIEKDGNQLEDYYRKNLDCSYWDFEYNGTTTREAAKNSIMASVVMYEILADQAAQKGISLSEKELSVNEDAVRDIIASASEEALNQIGLTYDVLKNAYNKKALGDKYRNELSRNFYIDEAAIREGLKPEDYREYKTECLFIPTVTIEDNEITPLSNEEITLAHATITEALNKLSKGEGMDVILNSYPALKYNTRDFVTGDKSCEEEYQTAATALQNDEYSPAVTTKYGYYIIHMLDNNSTDRYEQAVNDAIEAEEDDQFAKAYNEIKKQYHITINFDYWDTVTIGQITVPKE